MRPSRAGNGNARSTARCRIDLASHIDLAGGAGGPQRQHDGGFMPLLARRLYADGLGAPSMLFWRYDLAIVALAIAALFMQIDLRRVLRGGGWRIVLLGATLGSAQTLCFWESLKTLETSIAVLLFYTYPAVTLALDRLIVKQPIRPVAVL